MIEALCVVAMIAQAPYRAPCHIPACQELARGLQPMQAFPREIVWLRMPDGRFCLARPFTGEKAP